MAHELGHNLGMSHDFIDPISSPKTIRYDSNGNSCTDHNGVMDYYVVVTQLTNCSVEAFTDLYNYYLSNGGFCLELMSATGTRPSNNLILIFVI